MRMTQTEILEGEYSFKSNFQITPFLYMFGFSLEWLGCVAALDSDKQCWNTEKQSASGTRQYIHLKYTLSRSFHVTCMGDCSQQQSAAVYEKKILSTHSSANEYCLATAEPGSCRLITNTDSCHHDGNLNQSNVAVGHTFFECVSVAGIRGFQSLII